MKTLLQAWPIALFILAGTIGMSIFGINDYKISYYYNIPPILYVIISIYFNLKQTS